MKNYTVFKWPYILIEDARGKAQPFYKEYPKNVPCIDLASPLLCCPFSSARRSNQPRKRNREKPGYCEFCYIRYDSYFEHVNTIAHREYAVDDSNYKIIDEFIEDFIQKELFGSAEYLHSPCEKLEGTYSNNKMVIHDSSSETGSLIRMSLGSSSANDEIVDIQDVLNKIGQRNNNGRFQNMQ